MSNRRANKKPRKDGRTRNDEGKNNESPYLRGYPQSFKGWPGKKRRKR